jgi:hypothetical protein
MHLKSSVYHSIGGWLSVHNLIGGEGVQGESEVSPNTPYFIICALGLR